MCRGQASPGKMNLRVRIRGLDFLWYVRGVGEALSTLCSRCGGDLELRRV